MNLQKFKDNLSKSIYGATAKETIKSGLCIDCGKEALPKCYSDAGRREYQITGLCEECFDSIFEEKT